MYKEMALDKIAYYSNQVCLGKHDREGAIKACFNYIGMLEGKKLITHSQYMELIDIIEYEFY